MALRTRLASGVPFIERCLPSFVPGIPPDSNGYRSAQHQSHSAKRRTRPIPTANYVHERVETRPSTSFQALETPPLELVLSRRPDPAATSRRSQDVRGSRRHQNPPDPTGKSSHIGHAATMMRLAGSLRRWLIRRDGPTVSRPRLRLLRGRPAVWMPPWSHGPPSAESRQPDVP